MELDGGDAENHRNVRARVDCRGTKPIKEPSRPPTPRGLRREGAPLRPYPRVIPLAFGRIAKTQSSPAWPLSPPSSRTPEALLIPSGGAAMAVIRPPSANARFPLRSRLTEWVAASYCTWNGTGWRIFTTCFLTRRVEIQSTW